MKKRRMQLVIVFLLIFVLTAGCSGSGDSGNRDAQTLDYEGSYQENGDSGEEVSGVAGDQTYMGESEESAAGLKAQAQGQESSDTSLEVSQPDSQEQGTETSEAQTGDNSQTTEEAKKDKKEEKLVYTCSLTIETTTYKETMEEIEKQIKEYAGIIESQNEYDHDSGWYIDGHTKTSGTMTSTIVVKVPSKDYQAFLKSLDGKGKMTSKSMDVTNISRTYYDTQATIESLKIQETRLLKMMDEAKTIDDMITVESRLTEVQTRLNQYKTQLSGMDTQVAYSTITMTINEVLEYKQSPSGKKTNTFGQRLRNTLEESWSGFLSFMEGLLFLIIRLLPFAVVAAFLWFISRPLRIRFAEYRRERKAMKSDRQSRKRKKEKEKSRNYSERFKIGRKSREEEPDQEGREPETEPEPEPEQMVTDMEEDSRSEREPGEE